MRGLLAGPAVAVAPLGSPAAAHPHSDVDQQVQLSVGMESAEIAVTVVPSFRDGPAILAHLDADDDGAVLDGEAQAMADRVAASLRLTADGEAVAIGPARAEVAPAAEVRSGTGRVAVVARAPLDLADGEPHVLRFEVAFEEWAHEWFVQPFYHPDLLRAFGTPALERADDNAGVTIRLRPSRLAAVPAIPAARCAGARLRRGRSDASGPCPRVCAWGRPPGPAGRRLWPDARVWTRPG